MLLDFCFGFFVLSTLRLSRRNSLWTSISSIFLVVVASCLHPCSESREFLTWLSVASAVTALAGMRCGIAFSPLLLPLLKTPAGVAGLLTGIALNLAWRPRKPKQVRENYGIYRVA